MIFVEVPNDLSTNSPIEIYFFVDFISSMATEYSISSGSVHAVSVIIVKVAY